MLALGMDVEIVPGDSANKALYKSKAFFTRQELEYCKKSIESVIALICVKESCIKALSGLCGIPRYYYKDIELSHLYNGRPVLKLHRELGAYMKKHNLKAEVTISHTSILASAMVAIYRYD